MNLFAAATQSSALVVALHAIVGRRSPVHRLSAPSATWLSSILCLPQPPQSSSVLSPQSSSATVKGSLKSWLLPLQTKNWELERVIQDDEYENAVKYLREAVYSKPLVMSAFLPFVQLLLIGGNVKEALHELEMFGGYSNASLPTRLRACLLERVDPTNSLTLSTCFEDSLKSDPTCSESLAKLISLHQNGNYSPESLLEMIALHLDAILAEYNTWREFASCFLKVCQYEEDHMSVCLHGNEGRKKQGYSVHYNRIPKIFMQGRSGKAWRIRCRWWLARHFSKNLLASEMAAGDVELITYKAACASHMYGSHFEYVVEAYTCLEKRNNRDLFMFLQLHMQNSIGLNLYFQWRTN